MKSYVPDSLPLTQRGAVSEGREILSVRLATHKVCLCM